MAFAHKRSAILLAVTACSSRPPATTPMPAAPSCSDLACMQAHDGQDIDIAGTLTAPKRKVMDHYRIVLADGTTVIIGAGPARGQFTPESDGKRVVVRGRIFTGEIPESYSIVGRTAEPHLLDVAALTFVD
jgi:hypothetical protein